MTQNLTRPSPLLDYRHPTIARLCDTRHWQTLSPTDRIGAAYTFVRDEIAFGYNLRDDLAASRVLADGYGQCNTKSTLLSALLRGLGFETRLRGLAIHKSLQRGIVPEWAYRLAGDEVLHSWVEVRLNGEWRILEGVIMDRDLLTTLQASFPGRESLCAYGVGTTCLPRPAIEWRGTDTFIQKTGVIRDFGHFDTPDDFYAAHDQDRGAIRELLFRHVVRHQMNRRVARMRGGAIPAIPGGPDPAPTHALLFKDETTDAA